MTPEPIKPVLDREQLIEVAARALFEYEELADHGTHPVGWFNARAWIRADYRTAAEPVVDAIIAHLKGEGQ